MPRTGGRRARAHPVRPSINNQCHTSERKRESNSTGSGCFFGWLVGSGCSTFQTAGRMEWCTRAPQMLSDARARCTCVVRRRGSAEVRVRRRSCRALPRRARKPQIAARRGAAQRERAREGGRESGRGRRAARARARAGGRAGVCDDVGVDVRALEGCGPGVRARARPPLCGRRALAEAHGYVRAGEVCARRCEQAGGLAVYHASRHAAWLGRPLAGLVRRRRRA